MALGNILKQIDELQFVIDSYGKLDSEVLKKINYKFRLDWNYHSNAMEGNSLTKEETRSVMINNVTVEGKPIKDVLEIKGHDKVITDILKIGKGEIRLSEKRIKEIHKAIIHEDDIEQQKKIGEWKTANNHLINYKGEKFDFLPYNEVPEEMHNLIDWLNAQYDLVKTKREHALHPVLIAFHFHLRYVSIHPFYDGNGRTARVLTNLILISFGFPPVIVKVEEKNIYNQYLADIQGYGGSPDLFINFMCKLLIHSQELIFKAIRGESIEEPSDLDKGIELLKKSLTVLPGEIEKSPEIIQKLWNDSLGYLKDSFVVMQSKFKELFEESTLYINVNMKDEGLPIAIKTMELEKLFFEDITKVSKTTQIAFQAYFTTMKRHSSYSSSLKIEIVFSNISYSINNRRNIKIEKSYSESFTRDEVDNLIQQTGKSLLEELNKVTDTNQ
jgi:Fic family protein